jgi:hypothetical protein
MTSQNLGPLAFIFVILTQPVPGQVQELKPSKIIRLSDSIPNDFEDERFVTSTMLSRNGDLYFVVSSQHRTGILRTDSSLQRKSWIVLPGGFSYVRSFDVDEDGNAYFLRDIQRPQRQVFTEFDSSGNLVTSRISPEFGDKICWSGNGLAFVSADAIFTGADGTSEPNKHPYPPFASRYGLLVAPIPDGRIVVTDPVDAEIRIVRPATGETVVLRPQHPSIRPDPTAGVAAIEPVTTNEDGLLFLAPGPYRQGHFVLLEMNEHGDIMQTLEVVLPVVSQETEWKKTLQRDAIAVNGRDLYVLDRRGIVAVYHIG